MSTYVRANQSKQYNKMQFNAELVELAMLALESRLCVVQGPAGFGKTALIRHVLEVNRYQHVWLTFSELENETELFWQNISNAVSGKLRPRAGVGGIGKIVVDSSNTPDATESLEKPFEALLSELVRYSRSWQSSGSLILVLDQFETISNPQCQASFNNFVNQIPECIKIVIVSRVEPELQLAKRKAQRELAFINSRKLRCGRAQTEALLSAWCPVECSEAQIDQVWALSEGWITVISMLCSGLEDAADPELQLQLDLESPRFFDSYIETEVLPALSENTQAALGYLSLSPMAEPLAIKLDSQPSPLNRSSQFSGQFSSHLAFLELKRAGLLFDEPDTPRDLFFLPRIFRDWCARKKLLDQELAYRYRKEVAHWFEEHGYWSDAIDLYTASQKWKDAESCIRRAFVEWVRSGEIILAHRHLSGFPESSVETDPWLMFLDAFRLFYIREYTASLARLGRARVLVEELKDTKGDDEFAVDQLNGVSFCDRDLSDLADTIDYFAVYTAILSGNYDIAGFNSPSMNSISNRESEFLKPWGKQLTATRQFCAGNMIDAKREATESLTLALRLNNRAAIYASLDIFSSICFQLNDIQSLQHRLDEVETFVGVSWRKHPLGLVVPMVKGRLALDRSALAEAKRLFDEALDLASHTPYSMYHVYITFFRWWVSCSEGDFSAAQQAVTMLESLCPDPKRQRYSLTPSPARLSAINHTLINDFSAYFRWAAEFDPEQRLPVAVTYYDERLAWLQIRQLRGEYVHEAFQELYEETKALGMNRIALNALISSAVGHYYQGEPDLAVPLILKAGLKMQPENALRIFLDFGLERILPVLKIVNTTLGTQLVEHRTLNYVVAEIFGPREESNVVQGIPEPLSERETEVLRALDTGASNKQLSEKLGISLSTVKAHLRNIYGKMGVNNRTQALARARQRQILE
ncbi:LuxR C-terminal-related transcriptional regulator [Oleiphilus messinensis]|nr:LuxR C-terminal-related transcriptional regulator [Oleiphilus messinensis]